MADKIMVKWQVMRDRGRETFNPEDLGCENMAEWEKLTELEKMKRAQKALDELPEQLNMIADYWHKVKS